MPLLVRSDLGDLRSDVLTPYGYGGIQWNSALTEVELARCGERAPRRADRVAVRSIPPFLPEQADHSRGLPGLHVASNARTVVVDTSSDAEAMRARMHKRSRNAVSSAIRRGLAADIEPVTDARLAEFRALYDSTMVRVGAGGQHLHGDAYYAALLGPGSDLLVCTVRDEDGAAVAASLVLVDRSFAHYHLPRGTSSERRGRLGHHLGRRTRAHVGGCLRPHARHQWTSSTST
jgi:hypothetical protein